MVDPQRHRPDHRPAAGRRAHHPRARPTCTTTTSAAGCASRAVTRAISSAPPTRWASPPPDQDSTPCDRDRPSATCPGHARLQPLVLRTRGGCRGSRVFTGITAVRLDRAAGPAGPDHLALWPGGSMHRPGGWPMSCRLGRIFRPTAGASPATQSQGTLVYISAEKRSIRPHAERGRPCRGADRGPGRLAAYTPTWRPPHRRPPGRISPPRRRRHRGAHSASGSGGLTCGPGRLRRGFVPLRSRSAAASLPTWAG